MIGMVVRDREWRTLEPTSVRQRASPDGRWRVVASTPVGRATLHWVFDIEPRDRGFSAQVGMTAEGDVITNRSGLVMLLPAVTFAGARFTALHRNREATRGRLPHAIAPHQPMVDVAGLRVNPPGGPAIEFTFEGDDFEMEDHRNWLDPTFKLYSRSLARPYPYRIRNGATVTQRITVDLADERRIEPVSRPRSPQAGRLPVLGVATALARVPRDEAVVAALREASPAFVLHRTDASARGVIAARRFSQKLGAELRIEALGDGDRLIDALVQAQPTAVALHSSSAAARNALHACLPTTALTGGTFADFVMVNRNGVVPDAQRVMFALCPTVHARDDRSLIESLEGLPYALRQARQLAGRRSLDVGPVSLRRRLVPRNGRPADRPVSPEGVPYDVDPRQAMPIAAAWLATAMVVAGTHGVASFTAFEASGARGLVGDREAFPPPRGLDEGRRSASHAVFAALAAKPRARLVLHDLDAFTGAAFAIDLAQPELWLVDLAGRPRDIPRGAHRRGTLVLDDARRGARWMPMRGTHIPPFGIVRVTVGALDDPSVRAIARAWCRSQPLVQRGQAR